MNEPKYMILITMKIDSYDIYTFGNLLLILGEDELNLHKGDLIEVLSKDYKISGMANQSS